MKMSYRHKNYRHNDFSNFLGRFAIAFTFTMLLPSSSSAFTPLKTSGGGTIVFSAESSDLTNSKVELAHHLPILDAIRLEVLVVVAYYPNNDSEVILNANKGLALKRANAVRQFFLDAGVPVDKTYAEARQIKFPKDLHSPLVQPQLRTVEFEYVGLCMPDYRATCEKMCPDQHCTGR